MCCVRTWKVQEVPKKEKAKAGSKMVIKINNIKVEHVC